MLRYDVVVIGSGPAGENGAVQAGYLGKRVALFSMALCGLLAASKIAVGLIGGSTAVVADGVESASDILASSVVLFGLMFAAKPPDDEHPYDGDVRQ